jgi:hypothetical protein
MSERTYTPGTRAWALNELQPLQSTINHQQAYDILSQEPTLAYDNTCTMDHFIWTDIFRMGEAITFGGRTAIMYQPLSLATEDLDDHIEYLSYSGELRYKQRRHLTPTGRKYQLVTDRAVEKGDYNAIAENMTYLPWDNRYHRLRGGLVKLPKVKGLSPVAMLGTMPNPKSRHQYIEYLTLDGYIGNVAAPKIQPIDALYTFQVKEDQYVKNQ